MRILDQGRTIPAPAPVDYEGFLKMEGTSGLHGRPLPYAFKFEFRQDIVVVQITEPLAGAASCQGLRGGSRRWLAGRPPLQPPLRQPAAAAAAPTAAAAPAAASCGRP